jgi:hypothetical protein
MILEWDVPFQLVPSVNNAGTTPSLPSLGINQLLTVEATPLGYLLLDPSKCKAGASLRITRNNLAQADGEITHRKFKTGYVMELNAQLWETIPDGEPACAGALRVLGDLLGEYLDAMLNDDGQLIWQPSGWPDPDTLPNPRMLDRCRFMGPSGSETSGSDFVAVDVEKDASTPLTDLTFALLSPLPYITDFMDYPTTPDATVTFDSGTQVVTNEGNTGYNPIIRAHGAASGFWLTNLSVVDEIGNPLSIYYDSTLPGGVPIPSGGYVEIDTFTNDVIVHQPGGGTDNGKGSIDATQTDYFQLVPGDNNLLLTWFDGPGTGVDIIYRNAWT